jgi:hypothetical protein
MKKIAKHIHLLFLLSAPTVALVTAVLRTVALLTSYESDIGRYASQTLSTVVTAVLAFAALVLAILTHELRELFVVRADYRDLPTLFAEVFGAIALVFFAITLPIDAAGTSTIPFAMAIAAAVLALPGAALFILRAIRSEAEGATFALLTLPLALIGIPIILYLDLNGGLRVGDPAVLLAIFTWVLVGFFFLGEARIALGRAKWALHTYVTVMTAMLTATLSLPNLIYRAVVGSAIFGNIMTDFLTLAVFLLSMARLAAIFVASRREEKPIIRFAMDLPIEEEKPAEADTATEQDNTPEEKGTDTATKENNDEEATDR